MKHSNLSSLGHCSALCLLAVVIVTACATDSAGIQERAAAKVKSLGQALENSSLKVMTYNIKWHGRGADGKFYSSRFESRKPIILNVLTQFGADIIGLQEASIEQRTLIAPEIPEFGMSPLPTESGDECILFRLSRFELLDRGRDFLRREPEVTGTNIGVRDFVWLHLLDRSSGKRFYVLNFHSDHRSSARGRQLDGILIGKWIENRKHPDPVVLTGDFNGTPDKPRYLYLTGQRTYPDEAGMPISTPMPMLDTFTAANPKTRYAGTANFGFSGRKNTAQIDYVFVPVDSTVISSKIIYYNENGYYPSDHFPLLSEFRLH